MGTLESFFFFVFLCLQPFVTAETCVTSYCHHTRPIVRFPFQIQVWQQEDRCGYPGFELSCNNRTQTVLNLPSSGDFIVSRINYDEQTILINDPEFCLPKRILQLNLSGSPFKQAYPVNYTFLNCSTEVPTWSRLVPIACLSRDNYTVMIRPSESAGFVESPWCHEISTVSVPVQWYFYQNRYPSDLSVDLQLKWTEPNCRDCEEQGGICGFKSDTGLKIRCSGARRSGLPRSVKYGIIIGAGIPGLVCIIGFACYICSKIRCYAHRLRHPAMELSPSSTILQPAVVVRGLDGPTIDSFPKTTLGESRRLPEQNDGTCPICLSEYQPKETLRTIPECNHSFHANCIDEWLRINATCPLCRNSPEGSGRLSSPRSTSTLFSSSSSSLS